MYCPNCGAEVAQKDAQFCSNCGQQLPSESHQESAPTTPNNTQGDVSFTELKQPRERSRGRKGLVIGIGAAAVVVVAGIAFTVVAKPFASGKQLLAGGISSKSFSSAVQSSQENLTLSLKNIQVPGLAGAQAGLLSTLNGSTIDMNMLFDPQNKQAEIDFDSQYQSVKHSGHLWIDNNSAILSASDYQSLLAPVLPPGVQFPKYLTTDSSQAQALQKFWASLHSSSSQLTKSQQQAVVDMEKILVNAIPDKYVKRSALNAITISFDQNGLEDILKSEVKAVYAHKTEVADGINALSQASSTPAQGNVEQNVINALNRVPEEAAMAAITTAFNSGTVGVGNTSLTLTKQMFGKGLTESLNGGVSIHSPNMSMTLGYKLNAHAPAAGKVQMPSPSSSDSKTFTQWVLQAQGYNGSF